MKRKNANIFLQLLVGSIFSVIILLITLTLIFYFTDKSFEFGKKWGTDISKIETSVDVEFVLTQTTSIEDTANLLEERGVISDASLYNSWCEKSDIKDDYEQGEYLLNTSMENNEIDATLRGETESTSTPKEDTPKN